MTDVQDDAQDKGRDHTGEQNGSEASDHRFSPTRIADPRLRFEFERAVIWSLVVGGIILAVYIAKPLLVVFGAMVFAAMIDGGSRLLGRVLPIGRTWRVAIVILLGTLFFIWLGYFAGTTVSDEAAQFPAIIERQVNELIGWARAQGLDISQEQLQSHIGSVTSGIGTVTRALGGLFGGFTTVVLILIIGIYVALEPKLYQRGLAWMLPRGQRSRFAETLDRMAFTLRRLMAGRLLGMVVEGAFTYVMLAYFSRLVGVGEVPMAALLAILTGLLAFIPNLGAIVSGILMALVGFSGGVDMGIYTIVVYLFVQNFDGYVIIPMIAKKTVDLAPALVLAAQLVMGILFGILGIFLADPLLAMLKVALERRAEQNRDEENARAAATVVPPGSESPLRDSHPNGA